MIGKNRVRLSTRTERNMLDASPKNPPATKYHKNLKYSLATASNEYFNELLNNDY